MEKICSPGATLKGNNLLPQVLLLKERICSPGVTHKGRICPLVLNLKETICFPYGEQILSIKSDSILKALLAAQFLFMKIQPVFLETFYVLCPALISLNVTFSYLCIPRSFYRWKGLKKKGRRKSIHRYSETLKIWTPILSKCLAHSKLIWDTLNSENWAYLWMSI